VQEGKDEEGEEVKHISTLDMWHVEHEGKNYVVKRNDLWQEGEQEWFVYEEETLLELSDMAKEKKHTIVRIVQQELMRR